MTYQDEKIMALFLAIIDWTRNLSCMSSSVVFIHAQVFIIMFGNIMKVSENIH